MKEAEKKAILLFLGSGTAILGIGVTSLRTQRLNMCARYVHFQLPKVSGV